MCFKWPVSLTRSPMIFFSGAIFLGLMGCVGAGGTQVQLAHDALSTPTQSFSESILMQKSADDDRMSSRIGHATFTLFAIESGDVTSTTPLTEEVVTHVRQALESLGYQVTLVDSTHPVPNPSSILKVRINKYYFQNYNWLWPIVPTWGSIALELIIQNADGKASYQKSFSGSGNSYCLTGECAFGVAMKEALTEVLNKIVEACSSDEFRHAVKT
jgi:hypothetical protein